MSPLEYRFTIKYHGEKASRLVSGNLPRSQICSIFKDDLTALGVNHPKMEKIRQDSFGSIYFTYFLDKNNDSQHRRYLAVETTQYKDPGIFNVKTLCSIQHITTILEKNAPTYDSWELENENVSKPGGASKRDGSVSTSSPRGPSSYEKARKRPRLSVELIPQQSIDGPSPSIDPKTSVPTAGGSSTSQPSPRSGDTIPVTSPQISIKVEQEEASITTILNPSNSASAPPAKAFVPLNTRPANPKASISSRPNALTAYAKSKEVNRLTRELRDTRRVLSAAQGRESSLMKELQKLTGSNLGNATGSQGQPADMETRLTLSETELQSERTKRLKAERCLKDVERECRNPFVVPALLKAFITISQMTDGRVVSLPAVDANK